MLKNELTVFLLHSRLLFHSSYEVHKIWELCDKCFHVDILYGHMSFQLWWVMIAAHFS